MTDKPRACAKLQQLTHTAQLPQRGNPNSLPQDVSLQSPHITPLVATAVAADQPSIQLKCCCAGHRAVVADFSQDAGNVEVTGLPTYCAGKDAQPL